MKNIKFPALFVTGLISFKVMIPFVLMLLFAACAKEDKVVLFNGEDLGNWDKVVFDSTASPDEVFRVTDGVIRVSGQPFGYLSTKESYSNYKLHLEWRWEDEPTNSGVFLHVQEANLQEFPLCIEAQLMSSNAGDFVLIGKGSGLSAGDSTYTVEPEESRYEPVKKSGESSENPAGEWNTYEITCRGNTIELIVNGVVQNLATGARFSSGPIALQSEGSPIEFRNIYLTTLDK